MTVVTTRPDASAGGWSIVGGAGSGQAATNDNSDATYLVIDHAFARTMAFAEPGGVPAGAVYKSIALRARLAEAAGNPAAVLNVTLRPSGVTYQAVITWTSPTTATVIPATAISSAPSAIEVDLSKQGLETPFVYELYIDTVYVAKPTVTVDSPTGTLTTDNAPAIGWTPALDADGGEQAFYEVRIFNSTQYGAGGFSAGASAATAESGILAGNATSWDPSDIDATLPNATYKAYVRVGQTVNGVTHWSNYTAGSTFTINVPLPAVPTITLTAQEDYGRVRIVAADPGGGAATTDLFQIQRSDDGGTTWENVRTLLGDGLVDDDDAAAYDREASNGLTVSYRARSIHDSTGTYAFSAWASDDISWESSQQWLKHPYDPTLDVPVIFTSQPGRRRQARQGVFQPLGATRPVVVSDTRGSPQGELALMVAEDDLDTFWGLLDANVPILVQAPADHKWNDRWVSFGDVDSTRFVDKAWSEEGQQSAPWVEVARPDGNLVAWPS